MKAKCQAHVDRGATRIRGYHDTEPCKYPAKYNVIYNTGWVEQLCGVHTNALLKKGYNIQVEKLADDSHCSECVHYEACSNCFMYCKALQRRITARKTPRYCKHYKSFIKEEKGYEKDSTVRKL